MGILHGKCAMMHGWVSEWMISGEMPTRERSWWNVIYQGKHQNGDESWPMP